MAWNTEVWDSIMTLIREYSVSFLFQGIAVKKSQSTSAFKSIWSSLGKIYGQSCWNVLSNTHGRGVLLVILMRFGTLMKEI